MPSTVQTVYYSADLLAKHSHFHDCHQIILILKGKVEFCVNDTWLPAEAGDIALFSRYENHSVRVCSAAYERFVLQIDPNVANQTSPVYSLLTDRPTGFRNVIRVCDYMDDVTGIFRRLLAEHTESNAFADEMEQLMVKQLLITLYRCMPVPFDRLRDDVVMQVKRQFENNYSESYTLESLARRYSVSASALSHRFHAVTGSSVMEYLQSCRIANAKRMLANTELSIGDIVAQCGFSDHSNFSRTFKSQNGLSPSAFRRKYKTE